MDRAETYSTLSSQCASIDTGIISSQAIASQPLTRRMKTGSPCTIAHKDLTGPIRLLLLLLFGPRSEERLMRIAAGQSPLWGVGIQDAAQGTVMSDPKDWLLRLATGLSNRKAPDRSRGPLMEPPIGIEPMTYSLRVNRSGRLS